MAKKRIIDGVHKGKRRAKPPPFWTLCGMELSQVFSDIIYDKDLLTKCYCKIRSRDFDEEFIVEITAGIPGALICSKDIDPDEFLSQNLPQSKYTQPFLIINDVGTGKTTYLYYYFLLGVKEYRLDSKIDGILINIREFGEGEDIPSEKLEEFIHDKIHEHLTSKYQDISSPGIELGEELFADELIPFKSLIKHKKQKSGSDYEDYLFSKIDNFVSEIKLFNRARLRYLGKKGKKIFIVIDNVDHFGRKTQERIFGLSTKLLNELKVDVIMSARDYTLPSAFRHVPLSAFQPRFLHLALPDTKGILQKRISWLFESDFIGKIFNFIDKDQIEIYTPSGSRCVFDQSNLQKEFNIILDSLLNDKEIIEILENISNYDMRIMLKMVRVALSSGYLFPEEREVRDKVRPRDFLRAITCGNNPFYFPDDPSTMVLNLFDDNDPNYEGNNLIRIRTLQAIKLFGNKAPIDEVLKFMESLGYNSEKVKDTMQLLMDVSLIESPYHEGSNIERDQIKILKLTFAGEFYLNRLIFNDVYLDEVKNATYLDDLYIDMIQSYMKNGTDLRRTKIERISSRLEATKTFIQALINEEDREEKRVKGLNDPTSVTNYEKVKGIIGNIQKRYEKASERIISSIQE